MNHIKEFSLKNFGPWENINIELHPGTNVIIGESGGGKSGLLKGLDFVINNKTPESANPPNGFITRPFEKGKIGEVGVVFDTNGNEDKIIRRKGASVNTYQLNNNTLQKAFAKGIPDDIKNVINMDSINYHRQIDRPFLLDAKPGDVAKQLASIVDLSYIEKVVKYSNQLVRESNAEIKLLSSEIEHIDTDLEKLFGINEIQGDLQKLSDIEHQIVRVDAECDYIDECLYTIDESKSKTQDLQILINLKAHLYKMDALEKEVKIIQSEIDDISSSLKIIKKAFLLEGAYNQIIDIRIDIDNTIGKQGVINDLWSDTNDIDIALENIFRSDNIARAIEKYVELKPDIEKMACLQKNINDEENHCKYTKNIVYIIKQSEKNILELKEQLELSKEEMFGLDGQICPTCKQIIKIRKE